MDKPVIIFGSTSIGKAAVDIFKSNGVVIYGILDEDKSLHGKEIDEIPILGATDDDNYLSIIGKKCDAFLAFDDNKIKKSFVQTLRREQKSMPVNAIHNRAFVSSAAILHHGTLINSQVSIGPYAEVGNHCILNSGAIIDHEAKLDDYVQIGAGSIINSGVEIAEGAFIGSGVTIVSGIKIGKNARIGAGSVVIEDVKEDQTVFGNPAKPV